MGRTKRSLLLFVTVAVLGTLVGCGSNPAVAGGGAQNMLASSSSGDLPYTITVNGNGLASATPDVVDIQLGVETINNDAAVAISDNAKSMNAVMDAIKALEIEDKDIQTANYNMWVEQVYDRDGMLTDQIRYHVNNQVNIRIRDLSKTGKLLEDALKAGANTVNGITFGVDDITALQSEARVKAIANAKAKAEELAAALGLRVGKVRQVSEYSSSSTPNIEYRMADGKGGGGETPIASGSFTVSLDVQIVFDIAQ